MSKVADPRSWASALVFEQIKPILTFRAWISVVGSSPSIGSMLDLEQSYPLPSVGKMFHVRFTQQRLGKFSNANSASLKNHAAHSTKSIVIACQAVEPIELAPTTGQRGAQFEAVPWLRRVGIK